MLWFYVTMKWFSLGFFIGCCINACRTSEHRGGWVFNAIFFALCTALAEYGRRRNIAKKE